MRRRGARGCTGCKSQLAITSLLSCMHMHHTQVVTGCAHAQMRSQEVHLLQVLERGRLVRVQRLGRHCWDDDALVLAVQTEAERRWQLLQVPAPVIPHFLAREGKSGPFGTMRYCMADETLLHADDTTVLELVYAHLLTLDGCT